MARKSEERNAQISEAPWSVAGASVENVIESYVAEPLLTSGEEACLAEALEDVETGRVYSFEDAERELFPES